MREWISTIARRCCRETGRLRPRYFSALSPRGTTRTTMMRASAAILLRHYILITPVISPAFRPSLLHANARRTLFRRPYFMLCRGRRFLADEGRLHFFGLFASAVACFEIISHATPLSPILPWRWLLLRSQISHRAARLPHFCAPTELGCCMRRRLIIAR